MYRSVEPVHFTDDELEIIYNVFQFDLLEKLTPEETEEISICEKIINKIKHCGIFCYEDDNLGGDSDEP